MVNVIGRSATIIVANEKELGRELSKFPRFWKVVSLKDTGGKIVAHLRKMGGLNKKVCLN